MTDIQYALTSVMPPSMLWYAIIPLMFLFSIWFFWKTFLEDYIEKHLKWESQKGVLDAGMKGIKNAMLVHIVQEYVMICIPKMKLNAMKITNFSKQSNEDWFEMESWMIPAFLIVFEFGIISGFILQHFYYKEFVDAVYFRIKDGKKK